MRIRQATLLFEARLLSDCAAEVSMKPSDAETLLTPQQHNALETSTTKPSPNLSPKFTISPKKPI